MKSNSKPGKSKMEDIKQWLERIERRLELSDTK